MEKFCIDCGIPISRKANKRCRPCYWKSKIGIKHTSEHIKKAADSNRGQKRSTETKKRISKALIKAYQNNLGLAKRGSNNPNWTGGRHYKNGYVLIYVPGHPARTTDNYVLEHRYIMEKILGRPLTSNELVHHRNGIKDDNRPDNLEIVLQKTHRGVVCCPYCQKNFMVK